MASRVAAQIANEILSDSCAIQKDNPMAEGLLNPRISSETFTKDREGEDSQNLTASSSYTLARESLLSSDVDRWIAGGTPTESTGVQNSRVELVQRSTLAMVPSLRTSGLWYFLAMMLPLLSMNSSYTAWPCTPSMVLSTAELLLTSIVSLCNRIRSHLRRLARDQVVRDVFAAAMDVVLVVYAVGFLILSMYQASAFA